MTGVWWSRRLETWTTPPRNSEVRWGSSNPLGAALGPVLALGMHSRDGTGAQLCPAPTWEVLACSWLPQDSTLREGPCPDRIQCLDHTARAQRAGKSQIPNPCLWCWIWGWFRADAPFIPPVVVLCFLLKEIFKISVPHFALCLHLSLRAVSTAPIPPFLQHPKTSQNIHFPTLSQDPTKH